ncbi:hypothetical protein HZA43_05680 [Candidatus Peregrinibacteria bacterium]|nr:hypothetical protein [Candidatus Peregrinibacteria bacterium]
MPSRSFKERPVFPEKDFDPESGRFRHVACETGGIINEERDRFFSDALRKALIISQRKYVEQVLKPMMYQTGVVAWSASASEGRILTPAGVSYPDLLLDRIFVNGDMDEAYPQLTKVFAIEKAAKLSSRHKGLS